VKAPKWALAIVMMILGLLLALQFRMTNQITVDPSRMRSEDLAVSLQERTAELEAANTELTKVRAELERLKVAIPSAQPNQDLEILAGTIDLEGPGVKVTLQETPEALAAKTRLADEDIWRALNELFTAGAEAVSVNGQRISSVTGVRNVGSRILVNQTMIAAPVEILAIGDPTVLEASLKLRGGVIDYLSRWGIKVSVEKGDAIQVPALRTTPTFRFVKPAM